MKTSTQKWIYGLGAAAISGGSSSVVSGLTSMGIAPDKFNMNSTSGMIHLFAMMLANFAISGFLGTMLYLKQSPLPPEDSNNNPPKP